MIDLAYFLSSVQRELQNTILSFEDNNYIDVKSGLISTDFRATLYVMFPDNTTYFREAGYESNTVNHGCGDICAHRSQVFGCRAMKRLEVGRVRGRCAVRVLPDVQGITRTGSTDCGAEGDRWTFDDMGTAYPGTAPRSI